jgi:hypothetical protein
VDGTRFDVWTQMLVADSSRRLTLKAVAGGALGGLLAALGREEAEAKCVKLGKTCKKNKGKNKKCCGGAKCKGKKCKCPIGTEECDGKCVDPGACPCPSGTEECNGECVEPGACPCSGGTEECDGECVAACLAGLQNRNPTNCNCCQAAGAPPSPGCAQFGPCCGVCVPLGGGMGICAGRAGGSACEFDAQCSSDICDNGTCTCNDETEACAAQEECCDGQCVAVCVPGVTARNPTNCSCCQANNAPPSPGCASFGPCCSGVCVPLGGGMSMCVGIASGNACEFDAQCQSGNCSNGACD